MDYRIKVIAGTKKEGLTLLRDGRLAVSVNAPRKEGLANERALILIAEYLDTRPENITLIKGHTQPTKVVSVKK